METQRTALTAPQGGRASPEEIKDWLEWAGSKMLAMGTSSPLPKAFGVNWPDIAPDVNTAYGYSGERLRPALPDSFEIQLMDKILEFPSLYITDIDTRRILNARALVTPIGNKYVHNWTNIAKMLHTHRRAVRLLHEKGLVVIAKGLPVDKASTIRPLLRPIPHRT